MNRRRFLGLLGLAAAAAVADPEALLWQPGAKTHILPPAQGWKSVDLAFTAADYQACIKDAAKKLADRIDADAMRLFRGEQRLFDKESGMSIRFVRDYWQKNGDLFTSRLDVLYGFGIIKPELAGLAVRIEA